MEREKQLESSINHYNNIVFNLCQSRRFWEKEMSHDTKVACKKWKKHIDLLECIQFKYTSVCYDGPGYDCTNEIPKLEEQYGKWIDAGCKTGSLWK